MPLSRLPEMAEVAIAMFAPELEGSQKEPPPKRFIFANLIDHMACEGLLQDLPRMLREMSNHDAARNEVAQVLHQVTTAMVRTADCEIAPHPLEHISTLSRPWHAVLGRSVPPICVYAYRSLNRPRH